jgi:hypothetical protein
MDQELIVEMVDTHLDAIETCVNAIAILAVAWAGIQRSREIEVIGTKFDRRQAFWAVTQTTFTITRR